MENKVDLIEIVNLMIQGAEEVCYYALNQWYGNKYNCEEDIRQSMIKEWNFKKQSIRPLANILKNQIREGAINV